MRQIDGLANCTDPTLRRYGVLGLIAGMLLVLAMGPILAAGAEPARSILDEPTPVVSQLSEPEAHGLGMVPADPSQQRLVRLPTRLTSASELPRSVDLTGSSLLLAGQPSAAGIPPVGDQGETNTCTGWAASYYYKTYQEWLEHDWDLLDGPPDYDPDYDHVFSPSFVYNQITEVTDYNCNDGARIGDALALIVNDGDLPYSQFPWNADNCGVQPSPAQQSAAEEYKGIGHGAFFISTGPPVGSLQDHDLTPLKQWLATDDPFIIGFPIYWEFDHHECYEAVMPPLYPGTYRGLHAVAVVGYDDDWAGVGGFKIINSWGEGWGCYGYGWLSYDFVRQYAWEAWWMTSNRRPWIAPHVPDRYSPTIGGLIEVDLTPYENDRDQSGTDLLWYVEGGTHSSASGELSSNDVIIFQPVPSGYSGYDDVTLVLRDSEGAEDRQEIRLGWFDMDNSYFLPLGLGN
jgi:C1A family cysteine protease